MFPLSSILNCSLYYILNVLCVFMVKESGSDSWGISGIDDELVAVVGESLTLIWFMREECNRRISEGRVSASGEVLHSWNCAIGDFAYERE